MKKADSSQFEALSQRVRLEVVKLWELNQGPISGALSLVDIYVVLFFGILDLEEWASNPHGQIRIIPKTTAANALYGTLKYAGLLGQEGAGGKASFLPPVIHRHKWVGDIDGALTRSLGQGIGLAFFAKYNGRDTRVITFISEGDIQAGAEQQARLATSWKLDNLTVVLDCNQIQSTYGIGIVDPTFEPDQQGHFKKLRAIWEAYGWKYSEIDGHDHDAIKRELTGIGKQDRPSIIVAKTSKGKGIPFIENDPIRYSHKLTPEDLKQARTILENDIAVAVREGRDTIVEPKLQRPVLEPRATIKAHLPEPPYDAEDLPLFIFREWAAKFRDLNPQSVFILNSDNPWPFDPHQPVYAPGIKSQHLQVGVNEKLALNIARGIANAGGLPIYTTPATHMQVVVEDLMHCAISQDPVLLVGTFPGTDLAHWGATHSSNRDAILFSFPGITVFQPATADDTWAILDGIYSNPKKYLPGYIRLPSRLTLPKHPQNLKRAGFEEAVANGFYWFEGKQSSKKVDVLFVTSGTVLIECMAAARELERQGLHCCVVNVLNLNEVNGPLINKLVRKSTTVISCIDADSLTLSNLLWKYLDNGQRYKLVARGIDDFSEGYFNREAVFAANGINASSLVELATKLNGRSTDT